MFIYFQVHIAVYATAKERETDVLNMKNGEKAGFYKKIYFKNLNTYLL